MLLVPSALPHAYERMVGDRPDAAQMANLAAGVDQPRVQG